MIGVVMHRLVGMGLERPKLHNCRHQLADEFRGTGGKCGVRDSVTRIDMNRQTRAAEGLCQLCGLPNR